MTLPADTTPGVQVTAVHASGDLLEAVTKLWRKHSDTLGFFPTGAFEDYARKGRLFAALGDGRVFLGYCAFRVGKDRAMIAHLCVAEEHRGKGVAAQLFDAVRAYAKQAELRGVGLYCRRDFEAANLWPKLTMSPRAEKQGRGSDGMKLTFWWHDLHRAELFDVGEADDSKAKAVLDLNILRDLHDHTEARNAEAQHLRSDWLADVLEFCVTSEILVEIDRLPETLRHHLRQVLAGYRELPHDHARYCAIRDALSAAHVVAKRPPKKVNDESDLRHVAMSAAAGAEFFVTRDEGMLARAEEIERQHGLKVLRPVQLIRELHAQANASLYQPARLASTRVESRVPMPVELERLSEILHEPARQETRAQFLALLRCVVSEVEARQTFAARIDAQELFVVSYLKNQHSREITLLRCTSHPLATTALRHLLARLVEETAREGHGQVRVAEPLLSPQVIGTLGEAGFRPEGSHWVKRTLRYCGVRAGFNSLAARLGLPEAAAQPAAVIEEDYWPAKILREGIANWSVPIRPHWAKELFDQKIAQNDLFGAQERLILSRENVYYTSALQSGIAGQCGRVVWYVSQDDQEPNAGHIRACSRLVEAVRGPAKELFRRFQRLGVFQFPDVKALAGGDPNGELIALRFADTELFEQPLEGKRGREFGINNNFVSPVLMGEVDFAKLYRTGMKLPPE